MNGKGKNETGSKSSHGIEPAVPAFTLASKTTGATVHAVDSSVKIQITGKQYRPNRVESQGISKDGKNSCVCHFSELGLSLNMTVEKTEVRVSLSGILHNHTDKPVHIEQMWFGECLVDLGGAAMDYRVYYNSGCQEASGTCRLSAIRSVATIEGLSGRVEGDDDANSGKAPLQAATARANTDPDDPDALGAAAMPHFASTCIQPEGIGSRYMTAVYCGKTKLGVCVGSASFARAEMVVFVTPGPTASAAQVSPVILYDNLQLDSGASVAVEQVAIFVDPSPLAAMERYVEHVVRAKGIALKPIARIAGLWNAWMAFTEEENNAGAEITAVEHQRAHLLPYGIHSMPVGVVWHKNNAFFESRCKPHLGTSLVEALRYAVERFPEGHYCAGLFWGAASECSDFFRQHPEAILRDREGHLCRRGPDNCGSWGRCPSPSFWVDFSHPSAREFFVAHLRLLAEVTPVRTFNFDFMGDHGDWQGAWNYAREDNNPYLTGAPHDTHLNRPFETDRVPLQAVRDTLGGDVVLRSYTAPFMRYLGLIDVVRTAADHLRTEYGGRQMPVNRDWLRGLMQNLAANLMFNGKWWWSDADAICVGTKVVPERIEECRVRSLMAFIMGGPITLGDKIQQMVPEQFRYYTVNLPATGYAARPLDLFERALPEIYHFPKDRTGYGHDLLTLMNLSDSPRDYAIQLAELGLDGNRLAFEFWTLKLSRTEGGVLRATLPPFACRHYALHRDGGIPQVLGTDFHLSMGAVEIGTVQWNEKDNVLSGTIERPAKETGRVFVWVPKLFEIDRSNSKVSGVGSTGDVFALDVEASSELATWQSSFRREKRKED